MLSAKTKKYELPINTFVKIGMNLALRQFWWGFLVPLVLLIPGFIWGGLIWWGIGFIVLEALYVLFWYIQFYGVSQVPQGKPLFERMFYEFENKHIKIMKSEREGNFLPYDQIKQVIKDKEGFILRIDNRFSFLYLPYAIFTGEQDIKFVEMLLRRKGLLAE